jgi:molecular chaperone DnaJ
MSDRVGFDDAAAEMTGVDAGMAKRCYYEVLEVERTAGDGELKSAFRKLAMKWHPDRNPSDKNCEVRFKEINEAYEILKDPDKRAAYDRFGHAAFEHAGSGAAHGFGDVASAFADIFDDLFGMGGARRGRGGGRERGADLRYNMEISLEEAYFGKTAQVRLPTSVTCEACSGSGAKVGTKPKACPTCGGQGRIRHAQGFFTLERTCPACQGRGQVIDNPCPSCSGSGRVTRERALSVNIPAGVEDGTRIRLAGEGEAGVRAGPAGDLYIFLAIGAHAFFHREGADLHCRVPISMVLAAIGGEIEVPTIDGNHSRVKVPEGTQSGRRFRLQGKGMPVLRSKQTGDMYIQVLVETPQKLSKRQRELLNEFERLSSQDTQPEAAGFFGKVKELLGRSGSA